MEDKRSVDTIRKLCDNICVREVSAVHEGKERIGLRWRSELMSFLSRPGLAGIEVIRFEL